MYFKSAKWEGEAKEFYITQECLHDVHLPKWLMGPEDAYVEGGFRREVGAVQQAPLLEGQGLICGIALCLPLAVSFLL